MMNQVMMKVAIWGTAAALTFGGFALVANGQPGPGGFRGGPRGGGPGGGGMLLGMFGTAIGLTDAQKAEIKSIFEAARASHAALETQLKAARDAERAAIQAGKTDAELAQLAASYSQLYTQLHTARLQTEAKVYKVLTPEQREKVAKLREEMRSRFANGGGPGRAGRGPGAPREF